MFPTCSQGSKFTPLLIQLGPHFSLYCVARCRGEVAIHLTGQGRKPKLCPPAKVRVGFPCREVLAQTYHRNHCVEGKYSNCVKV